MVVITIALANGAMIVLRIFRHLVGSLFSPSVIVVHSSSDAGTLWFMDKE